MTTVFVDRTLVQTTLATLLTAALVGAGKPVQAVFDYQVDDIGTKSPVVIVTSKGSNRRNPEKSARNKSWVYPDVHVLVRYSNGTGWTPRDSEVALNTIEKLIAGVVADNQETTVWMSLDFNGQSEIEPVVISGKEYRYETIPLAAEVMA